MERDIYERWQNKKSFAIVYRGKQVVVYGTFGVMSFSDYNKAQDFLVKQRYTKVGY